MKIFIDVNTRIAQRSDGSPLPPFRFFSGNVLRLDIVFVDGSTVVTADTLADDAIMRIGIKQFGAVGDILAGVSAYEISGVEAQAVLDLTGDDLADFLDETVPAQQTSVGVLFEITVSNADESLKQTMHQSIANVVRGVIADGDIPYTAPVASGTVITDNAGAAITDNEGNSITET